MTPAEIEAARACYVEALAAERDAALATTMERDHYELQAVAQAAAKETA